MNSTRPGIPAPPTGVVLMDPTCRDDQATTPTRYSQLKYVLFSWTHNPLTKRDPLANQYFKQSVQMSNFAASIGGYPLVIYEASLGPDKPIELFLSSNQCETLMDGLVQKMGPTRARQTWKKDAVHHHSKLYDFKTYQFPDQESLEKRFAQLKQLNDFFETAGRYTALVRAQEIVGHIEQHPGDRQARYIAIDIETYERDHDLVTEVGVAKSTWRNGSFETMQTEHFVVAENKQYRNGKFCPDARDHFHFGTSRTLSSQAIVDFLTAEMLAPAGPVFLLLHDVRSDLKSLTLLGLALAAFVRTSPLPPPADETSYLDQEARGRFILDTQTLYSGYNRLKKQARLGDCLKQFDISLRDEKNTLDGLGGYSSTTTKTGKSDDDELKLHNSGNDAWGTLMLFWKLVELRRTR
ncbi:uncharacterized protein JCM15063_003707 [Sporobolomyces koalae]|uniref:uncharacterized protein n=1 Tax=Sporobolomyces koalae TaxID=500713 RepID=UPI003177E6F6